MSRVLVTGGAGFIGSHLTEALLARGDQVTVVDDTSTGSLANLDSVRDNPQLTLVEGDVQEPQLVEQLVEGQDEVYHLAAAVGVALIARQPIETIQRNIYPTQLILAALKERHQQGEDLKVFLASTSEVYGKNPKESWCEEDDLVLGATTRPRWSYGASKAIDEFLALACWRQFQLPVIIGRFFNVVGPRQSGAYGMVLPRFVTAALANQPLTVHDDGQQVRCFAHVDDVVSAVLALMHSSDALGQVINIGSDEPISILGLAERVVELSGSGSQIDFQSYTDAYDSDFEDIRRRVPQLGRLRGLIPDPIKHDLDAIIRDVIQYQQQAGLAQG